MYNTKKNTQKWPTILIFLSIVLTLTSIIIQNQFALFSFPIFLGTLIAAILFNSLSMILSLKARSQTYTIILLILNLLIIAFLGFTIFTLLMA